MSEQADVARGRGVALVQAGRFEQAVRTAVA
jgi:hypothetical protein